MFLRRVWNPDWFWTPLPAASPLICECQFQVHLHPPLVHEVPSMPAGTLETSCIPLELRLSISATFTSTMAREVPSMPTGILETCCVTVCVCDCYSWLHQRWRMRLMFRQEHLTPPASLLVFECKQMHQHTNLHWTRQDWLEHHDPCSKPQWTPIVLGVENHGPRADWKTTRCIVIQSARGMWSW